MSKILKSNVLQEAMEICHYFWKSGWGEFHAGNMSYLLDETQIQEFEEELIGNRKIPVNFSTQGLTGKIFLVTRSGAVFRNILKKPVQDFGILKVRENSLEILWGFEGDNLPTSELSAHLLCHSKRLANNDQNKIVLHCHPTYTIAMTFDHELDEQKLTDTLWKLNSECVLVFPDGIGLLPWMVCGEAGGIGEATAKKMLTHRIVIWPYHGMFAAGNDFDEVVGLIETIEKNAQVYMLTKNKKNPGISDSQLEDLAQAFGVEMHG